MAIHRIGLRQRMKRRSTAVNSGIAVQQAPDGAQEFGFAAAVDLLRITESADQARAAKFN
jgi:hypothetical protein